MCHCTIKYRSDVLVEYIHGCRLVKNYDDMLQVKYRIHYIDLNSG